MSTRKETRSELGAALKDLAKGPSANLYKEEVWTQLEDLAAREQRPDELGELYRKVIRETQRADLVAVLAPRAVRFHEEWFGAKADELEEILTRVLAVDPAAEWALRRLSVFYTVKERWNDLLGVYDRSLAGVDDTTQRRELLTEAVRVAKDFVGDTDRTIGYLTDLQRLTPGDAHLAGQLERLLERQGRWGELGALWRSRAPGLAPAESRALRARTAALLLDRLGDPAGALAEVRPLLMDPEAGDAGVPLAEKILRLPAAPLEVRGQALALLRDRYTATGRPTELVAVLEAALEFAGPGERGPLHREIGEQLAATGNRRAAMEHLSVQLGLQPADDEVLDRLRGLAESEGDPRSYLRALDGAAEATPDSGRKVALWLEAARIHDETTRDPAAAVGYYRRAFRESSADPAARLNAARKLVDRLAEVPDAAEAPGERLVVLEALAAELQTAAPRSGERRAALVETARAAEERGDLERAAGAFNRLLEVDPGDRSALDGLVGLLERAGQWEALVGALRRRMAVVGTEAEKRSDLTRVANLQANELGQPAVAIDTWLEIQRAFVDPDAPAGAGDEQITESLAALYVRTDRWSDLAELLGKAGAREEARLGDRLVRLGDAFRDRLADPRRAIDCYARALQVSPANEAALAGARALLEVPSCRAAAAESLAKALEARGDWAAVLQLAEIRVQTAADDAARVRLRSEAAALAERRVGDAPAALSFIARAASLAPDDAALERELARLGADTRSFGPVVEALRAAAAGTRAPLRAARLRLQEGQLDEVELQDLAGALDAYRSAY
jgi:tetratricopeptide (TPR) repeat protein